MLRPVRVLSHRYHALLAPLLLAHCGSPRQSLRGAAARPERAPPATAPSEAEQGARSLAAPENGRDAAIARLEDFIAKYSGATGQPELTPAAMHRLAALYE